jgi:hypothetical protein
MEAKSCATNIYPVFFWRPKGSIGGWLEDMWTR